MEQIKNSIINRLFVVFVLVSIGLLCPTLVSSQNIIPAPLERTDGIGNFELNSATKLFTNLRGKEKKLMKRYLETLPVRFKKGHQKDTENILQLLINPTDEKLQSPEGYTLTVTPKGITINAKSGAGLFYGLQTVLQLSKPLSNKELSIPSIQITDSPRFAYRGLMIDVSRHFFPKAFIEKQIDALAYYKINRLHLHLTDAGGWRLEIKKYPKLTEQTAYRTESDWGKWWGISDNRKYCKKEDKGAYGGYFTQNDIRDIVKYAAIRKITVIPEIEMPGHSDEVLAAYPELACPGSKGSSDYCVGNEATFTFLQNVLKEIMKLFPSEYIHVGGDEAVKRAWKTCPLCQKRMQDEHLANVDELQSYLICRIEKYLNAHGRKLLGWDEILQGKLAPNASVMSWRGEEGGIAAANAHHQAFMTPESYCYLDHYQDVPFSQPKAIGGYLTLEKAYSYNPVPDTLSIEEAKYINGVQGNLWTEYVPTPEHAEYMIYPRILALSEVGWSMPSHKSWMDFHQRALQAADYLRAKGYHPFDLKNEIGQRPESTTPIVHEALGKKVTYNAPYSSSYTANGDQTLTDGKRGNWDYGDIWQGFISPDGVDVTIDMEKVTDLHSISAEFMQSVGPEIYLPAEIIISVSDDGINFNPIDKENFTVTKDKDYLIKPYTWEGTAKGRYIRYQAHSEKKFGGWLFTDEIVVNPESTSK
jgi:hexosaminidase